MKLFNQPRVYFASANNQPPPNSLKEALRKLLEQHGATPDEFIKVACELKTEERSCPELENLLKAHKLDFKAVEYHKAEEQVYIVVTTDTDFNRNFREDDKIARQKISAIQDKLGELNLLNHWGSGVQIEGQMRSLVFVKQWPHGTREFLGHFS